MFYRNLVGLCLIFMFSACGGGGGGSNKQDASFIINLNATTNGSISLSSTQVAKDHQAVATLTPNQGYIIDSVSGCGGSLNGSTFTTAPITAGCTISATFIKEQVAISGIAAQGVALPNATLEAKCANNTGFRHPVVTDEHGNFSGELTKVDLPCALKVTSNNPSAVFYSIATSQGTVNVTPLTDLIIVLASRMSADEWYGSDHWVDVVNGLIDAANALRHGLEGAAYVLPDGDFDPIHTPFSVGEPMDVLMDALQRGIQQTNNIQVYSALSEKIRTGGGSNIPLPEGDQSQTADACFNPVLYAEGTTLKIKRSTKTIKVDKTTISGSNRVVEYTNKNITQLNSLPVLTKTYSFYDESLPEDGPVKSWGANGEAHMLVDLDAKTIAQVDDYYELDPALASDNFSLTKLTDRSTYTSLGNMIHFRFPNNKSYDEIFSLHAVLDATAIWGNSNSNMSDEQVANTRHFKGITSIQRAGASVRVCEFEVNEHKVVTGDAQYRNGEFTDTRSEYFLVGSGVDVSLDSITSVVLNGEELLVSTP